MPRYIPIDKGQMQFPQNSTPPTDFQAGDMWLDKDSLTPMVGFLNPDGTTQASPFASQKFVQDFMSSQGTFPSATLVTGRYLIVDKDNPNATDTRTGLSNYSISYPFRTIQAAIAKCVASDVLYIKKASTNYTENLTIITNPTTIILDGATIDGGIGITLTNSVNNVKIFFYNGSRITNAGNNADVENTPCINNLSAGSVSLYSFNGTSNQVLGISQVTSTNSYCIKNANASFPNFAIGILFSGKKIISTLSGMLCDGCVFLVNAGGNFTIGNSAQNRFVNCLFVAPVDNADFMTFTKTNQRFISCEFQKTTGTGILLGVNLTATSANQGIVIKNCRFLNRSGDCFIYTSTAAANNLVDISHCQFGAGGQTINIGGSGTGTVNITNNIINKAITLATYTPTCDIIAKNTLINDPLSLFPLIGYFG